MIEAVPTLRFAVLTAGELAAWEAACVQRLVVSGHAEPVLLLRGQPDHSLPGGVLYRLYREVWLDRRSRALRRVELPDSLASLATVDATDPAVREAGLDFILAFGARSTDDLAGAARHGVWRFDHGAAPGFREILDGEPRTEVTLRRLGPHPALLHRGWFGTCGASWVNNVDRAHLGCADWPARVCAEIRARGSAGAPERDLRPIDRLPGNREMVRLLARMGSHMVARLWQLLFHDEVWNVGFTRMSVGEIVRAGSVEADGVTWCGPHAPGRFIADPFACDEGDAERILVEELDSSGKGRICVLVPPHGPDRLELVPDLELAHHLSYPCIFVDGGETFCVPEAYQSGCAPLYRRVDGEWKLAARLLDGLPVVDPTLFKHAGRYWIFCTMQDDGAFGNLRLHGFHAEKLLGPWRPHALNPLKTDIGSARPAGAVITIDGQLHRPGQDCSRTYGGALVMNRITALSPTEFDEVPAARIEPLRDSLYPDGLHTINRTRAGAVLDGKRFSFHPLAWARNRGRLHEVFK